MSKRVFLKEFIKFPLELGAFVPSSKELCSLIVHEARVEESKTILEYGPGTGVCTREILKVRPQGSEVFAVEINDAMASQLKKQYPEVTVFQDSVENVRTLLAQHGHEKVQSIVGGIPWAAFSKDMRARLMKVTTEVMEPDGVFCTFAYISGLALPTGMGFRKELNDYFGDIRKSRIVWGNMPPAFVYVCRKPKTAG